MNNNKIIKNSLILSMGNGLSKVLGFGREVVIAGLFGASAMVDAYLIALTIPSVLFSLVNQALNIAIVPLVTEYQEKEGRSSVQLLLNTITTVLIIIIIVLIILGEVFSKPLLMLIAPGFQASTLNVAVLLTRIMMPIMILMGLTGIASGILQSQKRFLYPALMGVAYNLVIITIIIASSRIWGIAGLAIATLAGAAAQWIIQVPDLRKAGFRFRLEVLISHPGFKRMGLLIIPVLIGAGAAQINLLVDRMMASTLVEGSIAALGYASKFFTIFSAILTTAVASAVFPVLAKYAVEKDFINYLKLVTSSIKLLLLVVVPCAVGVIVLRMPIIRLAFERGAFDETATLLTVTALLYYFIGLPAFALQDISLRAFYSLQDTLTPMYIGIITVVINIVLILLLIKPLAIGGIALATSLSITIGAALLVFCLRRKLGPIGAKDLLINSLKILLAASLMGVLVFFFSELLQRIIVNNLSDLIIVFTSIIMGMSSYYIFIRLFKVPEVKLIENWVFGKLKPTN